MDNQNTLISGYRDLNAEEIALMNEIKQHEAKTLALVQKVRSRLSAQTVRASNGDKIEEVRLDLAEPQRWASIARTDFQTGFMALVRAVAQPQPIPAN